MPFVHKDVLQRLCQARDALRETRECPPTVPQVAHAAGISTFHFIRLFRACFGETPHQARLEARLSRAKSLLLGTDRSVTDICLDVGFPASAVSATPFLGALASPPPATRRKCEASFEGRAKPHPN